MARDIYLENKSCTISIRVCSAERRRSSTEQQNVIINLNRSQTSETVSLKKRIYQRWLFNVNSPVLVQTDLLFKNMADKSLHTTKSCFKTNPKTRLHDFTNRLICHVGTYRCQQQSTENLLNIQTSKLIRPFFNNTVIIQ